MLFLLRWWHLFGFNLPLQFFCFVNKNLLALLENFLFTHSVQVNKCAVWMIPTCWRNSLEVLFGLFFAFFVCIVIGWTQQLHQIALKYCRKVQCLFILKLGARNILNGRLLLEFIHTFDWSYFLRELRIWVVLAEALLSVQHMTHILIFWRASKSFKLISFCSLCVFELLFHLIRHHTVSGRWF